MHIPEGIMNIVERKEEDSRNFHRCLCVSICPQCGDGLKAKDVGGDHLIRTEYTCTKCHFTHTRLR